MAAAREPLLTPGCRRHGEICGLSLADDNEIVVNDLFRNMRRAEDPAQPSIGVDQEQRRSMIDRIVLFVLVAGHGLLCGCINDRNTKIASQILDAREFTGEANEFRIKYGT